MFSITEVEFSRYTQLILLLLLIYHAMDTMELLFFVFILTPFLCLSQVCCSVRSPKGVVSLSRVVELVPDKAAHSAPYVFHQEPGPLRGRHAHAAGEAHRARLEFLRLLHGPGTSLLWLCIFTVAFEFHPAKRMDVTFKSMPLINLRLI